MYQEEYSPREKLHLSVFWVIPNQLLRHDFNEKKKKKRYSCFAQGFILADFLE